VHKKGEAIHITSKKLKVPGGQTLLKKEGIMLRVSIRGRTVQNGIHQRTWGSSVRGSGLKKKGQREGFTGEEREKRIRIALVEDCYEKGGGGIPEGSTAWKEGKGRGSSEGKGGLKKGLGLNKKKNKHLCPELF